MEVVHKYNLKAGMNYIQAPLGACPLSLGWKDREPPVMWALCNPDNPMDVMRVLVVMTGEKFENSRHRRFIGTVVRASDGIVLHAFQDMNPVVAIGKESTQ